MSVEYASRPARTFRRMISFRFFFEEWNVALRHLDHPASDRDDNTKLESQSPPDRPKSPFPETPNRKPRSAFLSPQGVSETRARSGYRRGHHTSLSSIYSPPRISATHGREMYLGPCRIGRSNVTGRVTKGRLTQSRQESQFCEISGRHEMGTAANLLTNMGLGRARRLVERKQLQMRRRFKRLPLLLGGAAVHRCDNCHAFTAGFKPLR